MALNKILLFVALLGCSVLQDEVDGAPASPDPIQTPSPNDPEMILAVRFMECKKELNASDDDLKALNNNKPWTQNTKCMIKCVLEKSGVFKDGKLIESEILRMIDEDRKTDPKMATIELQIYSECKNIVGSGECDTAAQLAQCVTQHMFRN